MKNKNIGLIDRIIRIGLAVILLAIFFTQNITGLLALFMILIIGVLSITSFTGSCALYSAIGINSKKKNNR